VKAFFTSLLNLGFRLNAYAAQVEQRRDDMPNTNAAMLGTSPTPLRNLFLPANSWVTVRSPQVVCFRFSGWPDKKSEVFPDCQDHVTICHDSCFVLFGQAAHEMQVLVFLLIINSFWLDSLCRFFL
jgi:hypothetical protein